MSTPALIKFNNTLTIYKHFDGQDIADALMQIIPSNAKIDGLTGKEEEFNGLEDLSAYIICKLKHDKGDVYLRFRENHDSSIKYKLNFYVSAGKLYVNALLGEYIYAGTWREFCADQNRKKKEIC